MKKLLVHIILVLYYLTPASAQQDPMYSQYMFNMLSVNPAYAGSRNVMSLSTIYRKQWLGLDGAPRTGYFSIELPLPKQKISLGATVVDDKIGIVNQTYVNLIGSYKLKISNTGSLFLGLQGGINQYRADYAALDFSKTNSTNLPDQAFTESINRAFPNFGTGIYYTTDVFYLGISLPKLLKDDLSGSYNPNSDESTFRNRKNRHYFFSAGYVIHINEQLKLKPSILVKGVSGAPLELDLNTNLWLKNKFGFGLSYRTLDAIVALFEFQLTPQLRMGYAYDFPTTRLLRVSSGSHELMLRYEFGFSSKDVQSPRFF